MVDRLTLQHFAAPGSALPPGAVAQCSGCNLLVVSIQSAPHAGGVTVLADMATFAYTAHVYTPAGCMCIHDQRPYLFHVSTCTAICHSCRWLWCGMLVFVRLTLAATLKGKHLANPIRKYQYW